MIPCQKCNKPVRFFHKYKVLWVPEKDDFVAEHLTCEEADEQRSPSTKES